MPIEIDEIKHIRKKLGLTQKELAERAQVSQSLIAKIESGRLDPTYSNAKKIFGVLLEYGKKKESKASDIMTNKVISIQPEESVKEAIDKMRRHNISQMPVIDMNRCIGLVSETSILDSMLMNRGRKVKDVMDDCPPVVSKNTSISVLSDLLKFYSLIVVSDSGKLKGVITRSDILAKMYI